MKTLLFSYTTRILHFLFACFVLLAYLLSDTNSLLWLHSLFGICVLLIVGLRIFWFFVSEDGAKISSFDLKLSSLKNYVTNYFSFKNEKIRNPAASYSAILMWILAVLVSFVGLILIGAKYGSGIFGYLFLLDIDKHLIKEAHELFGNLLILVAFFHVAGVLGDNFLKRSDIAKAMFNGEMKVAQDKKISTFKNSSLIAFIVLSLTVLFGFYLGMVKTNIFFNSEISHQNYKLLAPTMVGECKECHLFYPPNVTSLETQMNILNDLPNHFGTDASLDNETLVKIINETKKLAPQKSPFRFEDLANSESIVKTNRWKHLHEEFDDGWFMENKVKKTNCKACHINFEDGSINPFELK